MFKFMKNMVIKDLEKEISDLKTKNECLESTWKYYLKQLEEKINENTELKVKLGNDKSNYEKYEKYNTQILEQKNIEIEHLKSEIRVLNGALKQLENMTYFKHKEDRGN